MLTFNDNKAGMAGLDKQKITKVIESNTSSTYSSFTKKQQQRVDERVLEIKQKLNSATTSERRKAKEEIDSLEIELEQHRDLDRHCVCIDMDAYFAAVEMRDDPKLRSVPMAVGSQSMLSTSNYIARRFGVRAAMPGFIAKKLCPSLVLVPGNYPQYSKVSRQFAEIFVEYDPDMGMMSLDEAYIDLTDYVANRTENRILKRRRYGGECICRLPILTEEPTERMDIEEEECGKCNKTRKVYIDEVEFGVGREEVVREMRFRVEQLTGLTCSAGIAANFMLAKICSDFNKPNGQFVLENCKEKIMKFLKELPIRKVSGIGRVCEANLQACDINTVGDMLEKRHILPLVFSQLSQESFLRTALGLPHRPSNSTDSKRKSISVERTFSSTSDFTILLAEHEEICKMLEEDVRKVELIGGRTITLKLKLASFDVLTRSLTPSDIVCTLEDIRKYSLELLEKEKGQEIRLLGVRLSQLVFKDDDVTKKEKTIFEFWNNAKRLKLDEEDELIEITQTTAPCPLCSEQLDNNIDTMNRHVDMCIERLKHRNEEDSPDLICIAVEAPKKDKKKESIVMKKKKTTKNKKVLTMDMFLKR